ncbi:peptidase family M1-domain-containing protein [Delphinella strobiligena]|nr:peptidase family M1-domain-containing protein [Delphinella strobiligena]
MHRSPAAILNRPISSDVDTEIHQPRDPNTLSNYNAWRTRHVTADLELDFKAKKVAGTIKYDMERLAKGIKEIVLDTSFIDVKEVKVAGKKVNWNLADRIEPYGSPLTIDVPSETGDADLEITISTTDKCTAVQWMTRQQTGNGRHPYMFSQCQAIHARSLFPCQDTPDVKSTFTFNIRSPLPVLASGLPTGSKLFEAGKGDEPGTLLYTFNQELPMPSYLFALASGDLASASIGPRSQVWTGPEELVSSQWEFESTEEFIQAAESIVYPYAWTTYNVLVLPPSFPYGGMENPIFTFATPTLISGDRQNVDVIAHELAHSWSGNLVSNASWEHFWLNEGWTVYIERRIMASLHGEAHRDFSAIIGWKALTDAISNYGEDHEFTKLVVDLKGQDPDDAFSSIPYEKGSTFLYYLEKLIGKEKWDKFIPHYFTTWKMKSLDSYDFKATLSDFFSNDAEASKKLNDLDWDTWFYKPGFPPKPDFDTSMVDVCYALASKWEALNTGKDTSFKPTAKDIEGWSGNQSVVFLESIQTLEKSLKPDLVDLMGKEYAYAKSKNVELVSRFYIVGLKAHDQGVYKPTAELLGTVGRMKFVRPLYKHLKECDEKLAQATFEKHKDFYHPICRDIVEKDMYG